MRRGLRNMRFQAKRRRQDIAAKSDVGDVARPPESTSRTVWLRGPMGLPGAAFHKTCAARLVTAKPNASRA
jgi:hypothetical protein